MKIPGHAFILRSLILMKFYDFSRGRILILILKYKHHFDHVVMLGGHAPYGRRHVVPSVVSLVGVYASPAKPALLFQSNKID